MELLVFINYMLFGALMFQMHLGLYEHPYMQDSGPGEDNERLRQHFHICQPIALVVSLLVFMPEADVWWVILGRCAGSLMALVQFIGLGLGVYDGCVSRDEWRDE